MATTHSVSPRLASSRIRASLLMIAVFTFFFAAYVFTASGDIFSTGDTTLRMELAENILGRASVELHGWTLTSTHHYKREYVDPRVSTGVGGRTYTTYLLGQPLAMAPFDKLGGALAVHERWPYGVAVAWIARLVGPLFGALEVTLFFLFCVRLGYGLRRTCLLTAIFGFATSVWPDEQSVLEHGEVAFFVLLAFYGAFRFREQRGNSLYLVLAGIGIGGAAITRYQDAFLALLGLMLYIVYPRGRSRRLLDRFWWLTLVFLGLLPFAALDLWYNWIRFGSFLATGHHETLFGYPIVKGVPGLLISPGKGFIWYCPVILLLALAVPRSFRRFPAFNLASLAVCVCFVLFYSHVTFWHGDPAWGPRYLYPLLPFLTLPLGEILRPWPRATPLVWMVTAGVVMVSFVIQFSAVSVNEWHTWYRVVSYEENHGHPWAWVASRYNYFWNIHESPLNFQIHGLYQLIYDDLRHSNKYEIVPPDEDPILDRMATDYAINQWNFWWSSNEFDWWIGQRKVLLAVTSLLAIMVASGTYVASEAIGVFASEPVQARSEPIPEAA